MGYSSDCLDTESRVAWVAMSHRDMSSVSERSALSGGVGNYNDTVRSRQTDS